ncbi:zinc finger BED domain-containing protein RICESLEEPER 1-like [Neltuma alba]|uniref:zinc finger BED domain-containing protein RICESLEEPER 1-like n=1 Tax=Neltuma alba TaxID=207710 RepID=UPI0010A32521|nr:zinc finger BED domain-containing protein RICESLEEPER 1-like [Prosopis alba]XP_028799843.1 zinc finger BED domain-containing protein RICESLEEPER 1-like [Prosopis alba]XP_028800300.1 zinc finger BED domain-containing protein RICESLEEPER 1-like [Prosopis alba]XP_028800302.1 zinc finger BED domain-containing protein RICESLEEPER 1-like [Prosopis alba]
MAQSQQDNIKAKTVVEESVEGPTENPSTVVQHAKNNNERQDAEEVAPPTKRKRRLTSDIWNHFTRLPLTQTKGKHRAKCNYCGIDYASHPTKTGTKQLWRHFEKCPKNPNKASKSQTMLTAMSSQSSQSYRLFNQERCRKALARFIIKDELPFRVLEGEGLKELLQEFEPRFQIPSRWTIARDCYQLYLEEAKRLKRYFKRSKCRVSLTTDCWTSIQNSNYMCLTAHWIDENWTLQKRILNFCVIENHKGDTIGKQIEDCLFSWGIEKVFTITVDNASSNDTAIAYLKKRLKSWNGLICDGEFLQMRCAAHILNLIVGEGLKEMNKSIELIRHAIKFVRSSPARLQRFKELVEKEKIDSKSLLTLDCPTRWNSTYLMLENAVKFIKVFDRMEEEDQDYKDYFKKKVKLFTNQQGVVLSYDDDDDDADVIDTTLGRATAEPPTAYDWSVAKEFLVFLRLFYTKTLKFSGSNFVTTSTCFQHIVAIQTHLHRSAASEYSLLSDMARRMQTKYDKYWGKAEKMNPLLIIAVILDPRFKMTYIKIAFEDIFPEPTKREAMLKKTMDVLYRLYDHYFASVAELDHGEASKSQSTADQQQVHDSVGTGDDDIDMLFHDDTDSTFQKFLATADTVVNAEKISEVDEYLQADLGGFRDPKFDVLAWWKVNAPKYRVLSVMARDLLAAPVSTVSSESVFSTGGRILDNFRSSLSAKMVEALICAQNWLCSSTPRLNDLELDNFIESANVVTEQESLVPSTATSSSSSEGEAHDYGGDDDDE